ncbi:MAG: threonylcarbamoyl-AMP synthase [Candidatus Doudnabacteria bacterium]|nr:threonylcarbamoyl-AMP synthase [Candidatus Doudnabacteria bacterium]
MRNKSNHSELDKAVQILKRGGVVAYPTDTAYGFAVDATNLSAIKKLYGLKGRDFNKPVSIIFPSLAQASKVVAFNPLSKKIAAKYWPGGVTLVLPLKSKARNWLILSAKTKTLGVRYPGNELALQLVKELGRPITATSANISGKPTGYSVNQIRKQYTNSKAQPDFYIDGGRSRSNSLSTMLHVEGRHVTLLREGVVSYHDIIRILK